MSAETTWTEVPCVLADLIRAHMDVRPHASKTDLGGTYGEPEVYTEWGVVHNGDDFAVLREWRFPDERAVDDPMGSTKYPDVKPCRHEVPTKGAES